MSEIEIGTVYDVNKQLVSKEKPLDPIEYATKMREMTMKMADDDTYYLLINNRDLHYYTLFDCHNSTIDGVTLQVSEILSFLGQVIDIIPNQLGGVTDGFEIWIKHEDFEEPIAFYMLNWEEGVIKCG